ncbi:hypothetical protein ZWY2020_000961 [Hordeum vulgare]|nr:hypothetical protein ZWY2020_000961 [Hordeum vulgare]
MAYKIAIAVVSILIQALLVSCDSAGHIVQCDVYSKAPDPYCYSIPACVQQCVDSGYPGGYCALKERICFCAKCTSQEPVKHPRKFLSLDN